MLNRDEIWKLKGSFNNLNFIISTKKKNFQQSQFCEWMRYPAGTNYQVDK